MLAHKFLTADGRAPISGFRWPTSGWVEATGALEVCRNGVHACRVEHLPHWIGAELWAIELDGEILEAPDGVAARRGRLLGRVEAWSGGSARELGEDCARRANAMAAGMPSAVDRAGDAAADAAQGWVSAAAYIAAAVAGEVMSGSRSGLVYEHHFLDERSRQAHWLQDHLHLE